MHKLMIFAHDPGGANAVFPLVHPLQSSGFDVIVCADGPAKNQNTITITKDNIDQFLCEEKPDFIITGTSANDFTEKYLWNAAEKLNIPTMAILDHWCNYGIRFSKYGLKDIEQYSKNKTFDYVPTYVCVMDEFAKLEMQKEGIPENKIYSLGNPHFETIKAQSKKVDVNIIRSRFLSNNKTKIITFASEPYEEDYGTSPERLAVNDLCKILSYHPDVSLVVKLHPKESLDKYNDITDCYFDKSIDSISMISASDIVISMTSMMLIETVILGKNALSYQPMERDKNKFILTRNNVLPFISDISNLNKHILNMLMIEKTRYNFHINFNATDDIVNFVRKNLCQS